MKKVHPLPEKRPLPSQRSAEISLDVGTAGLLPLALTDTRVSLPGVAPIVDDFDFAIRRNGLLPQIRPCLRKGLGTFWLATQTVHL